MAVDLTLERKLPQNLEAERSVLGAILLDNEAFHPAIEVLDPADFFLDSHRRIFGRMVNLSEENRAIDLITLHEELERAGELEAAGGSAYLSSLVDGVPRVSNVDHYARIVKQKALLRNLIHASDNIINQALEAQEEADEVLDRAEQAIFSLAEERIKVGLLSLREIARATIPRLDELFERRQHITGLATGFSDFDNLTSGLQPAELILLAARPAMGKTALALNIAQYVAAEQGKPAAVFSLEMAREALLFRFLCAEARVDSHKFRSGFLNREEMSRMTQALARLAEAPIYIDDTPGMTVLEVRAKCRRLQAEHGLALIVVDYLQLMSGRGRFENRNQEISSISRGLKALAKEVRVPLVAVSQLSRAPEQRGGDHRPQLSDLRESGSLEQDADVVAFIFRPEMYRDPETIPDEDRGRAELIIAKQRNGPTGKIHLAFLREFTRFENLLRQPAEE
ncbi:MAG TPA: replicative DNA helicase [Candidatus Acidoferrales bacterium]|nr:replicative DNA helicase [Candidatus Acidoferrales bacterium]